MKKSYDVIVIGGGPGGFSAAVAAAKDGADTLLIERYGFLGGMATAGLVNPFMSYKLKDKKLTSDVFNKLIKRLETNKALHKNEQIFDDEKMKYILDEMVKDYNIDILFHTLFVDADKKGNSIDKIYIENKSGRMSLSADVFIDATGDGDLAARAGAQFELGRNSDNLCQPMTLCFRVGGVEQGLHPGELREHLTEIMVEAKEQNLIEQPREDVLLFGTLQDSVWHFNTTRIVGESGIEADKLTEAEIEGRRQIKELMQLFKEKSPYFKNAYLLKMASQIGVRESRRIIGKYIIDEKDVINARKFSDGIARSNYNIDIHNPAGTGTVLKQLPPNDYYEIPFRCLVSDKLNNLVIGSRCISSTHEAHSSLRIMPVVSGIGEAAGCAAAKASNNNKKVNNIDGEKIKHEILS